MLYLKFAYYLSVDFGDNSFFEQIFLNGPVPQGDPEGELEGIRLKGPEIEIVYSI